MGKVIPFIILLLVFLYMIALLMISYCKENAKKVKENIISLIILFIFYNSLVFLAIGCYGLKNGYVALGLCLFTFSLGASDFLI